METLLSQVQTLNQRSNEPSTPYSATSPYFTRGKSLCINPSFKASIVVHKEADHMIIFYQPSWTILHHWSDTATRRIFCLQATTSSAWADRPAGK